MARAVIKAFPFLREENSTGCYTAWLATIVDALKNKRRDMQHCFEVQLRKSNKRILEEVVGGCHRSN